METDMETFVSFDPDEIIFRQGDFGDRMYFIREGRVRVVKELPDGEKKVIKMLGPGHPVGEIACILPDGRRTATVQAVTAVVAVETTRGDLLDMLYAAHPKLREIFKVLAHRLKDTTEQAAEKP